MIDMTPDEARKILDHGLFHLTEIEMNLYLERTLRTIVAVGDVLDYLNASARHKSEIKQSAYGDGYVDGLYIAIRRLEKALGVDYE